MRSKTLYLFPNFLSQDERKPERLITPALRQAVARLDGLFCESEKEGRRFLSHFELKDGRTIREMPLKLLNEHTSTLDMQALFSVYETSDAWGYLSDAGMPCLADPGHQLVQKAREGQIHVIAHAGFSSIFLALMLSGLPAQRFSFEGYLPRDKRELSQKLIQLQERALRERMTIAFMETPYRNRMLFEQLLLSLNHEMHLCVAIHLESPHEQIITQTIAEWKKAPLPDLHKQPSVFLLAPQE